MQCSNIFLYFLPLENARIKLSVVMKRATFMSFLFETCFYSKVIGYDLTIESYRVQGLLNVNTLRNSGVVCSWNKAMCNFSCFQNPMYRIFSENYSQALNAFVYYNLLHIFVYDLNHLRPIQTNNAQLKKELNVFAN